MGNGDKGISGDRWEIYRGGKYRLGMGFGLKGFSGVYFAARGRGGMAGLPVGMGGFRWGDWVLMEGIDWSGMVGD